MQQGLATSGEGIRNKRVIPTLAIIQGVAAIGRMMIKGINTLVDAKRASSFNNAIKLINENVQITHDRLITLENRTAMMAKAIIPVLKDFKQQINNANDRLYRQYQMMMKAYDRYNRLFRQTHKTFQIHHLALLMLKDYITILLGMLQRIHRQYIRYESALDDTLIGIEHLNSGYLTHRILEPRMLARYLEAVEDNLEETAPAFETVFTNVYQYYGNSLISFTNIIDDLLLKLPILIKLKVQVPMSLFSIETVPVPLDAETYLGEKREYTQIIPETELIALTKNNYIPLTQAQILLRAKIGYMYYCEYAHLLKKRTEHTCMSAIYYDQGSDIKVKQCKTIVTFDTIPKSKILDAGDLLILSNLQKPWTIACKDISRVFEIEYSTYRILNRSELCECSLTAGNYLLSYMNINCGNVPEARDGYFTAYCSFNKIVLDVITEKFDIQVDENTRKHTIDDLLLQLPMLIKLKVQVPMLLFSIETAPVPLDAETYIGEKREYTQIIPETELIALTENNYIPLTQAQILLCAKIGYIYYCEYAHLLKKHTEHTCMSATYYDQGSDVKAKQCKTIITFDTIPESKILDTGDLLILSNLQKPWTIACKDVSRVFEIEYSTYLILNRLELCECSLTAGNYLLSYTNINCGNVPEVRDGYFTTYYSFNKIVLDVITEKFDIQVDENTRKQATLLHDDIPGYDLPTIDFVNMTTDQDKDVSILEEDNSQIYAYLDDVLVHMIDNQQTAIFKLNQDFNKNKEKISQYIKYTENWQVASVICSYTAMACDVLLIVAMIIFLLKYQKTMQAMLAAFLQTNTKNSAIQSVQVDQIGRTYPPLFMINLPKEEEIIDDLREITVMEYVVQVIMIIVCIAIVLIIMYFCCTKCRHTRTIFKYCFPFLPILHIVRTSRRTDLFAEVTNITKGNGIWAHFVSTGCFPMQIQLSRPIQKDDVQIETVCCIFKWIRIN